MKSVPESDAKTSPPPHDHAAHAPDAKAPDPTSASAEGVATDAATASARDVFRIEGMDCAEEIAVLKRELGPLVGGVEHLGFDVLSGKMIVRTSARALPAAEIVRVVGVTGMKAVPWITDKGKRSAPARDSRMTAVLVSGVGLALGFGLHAGLAGSVMAALGSEGLGVAEGPPLAARIAYCLSILAGLWLVLPKALFAVRRLRPDMNLLMAIAVVGALAIDEWFEAATVTFLFAVSLALESWSVGRARKAVEALASLGAPKARVIRASGEIEVSPDEVQVGDRVVVRGGERFAVDGKVLEGEGDVNQAPITGESVPVSKHPGSDVYAGAINGDSVLVVEATKLAGESMLAKIATMVADAQSRRGASEQWVERFAAWYTPAILLAAVLIAAVPPLLGGDFDVWLYRALVLLVIGCPCSLVISTPVTVVAAIAAAARQGVLLKGGSFVEIPATLTAIALDKTGTLTEGRPRVVEVIALADHPEVELLERALALEQRSSHPLARAIVEHCLAAGVSAAPAEDLQLLQGRGATAVFRGKPYWIGSHRLLEERGQETPEVHERLEKLSAEGCSVVVIGNDEHVCGVLALRDGVRAESVSALRDIRAAGVKHIVMLTGDNKGTAALVAKETGVDVVKAELLPADKVTAIEELVRVYGRVAMVGDGVNDAPALARATLGISMGAAGTDVALETADVALMGDDLSKIAWLIHHSRRTLGVIRQNIGFSLAIKAVFVVLALLGISSLWMAIAADTGASLLVTLNGLRLLAAPRPSKTASVLRVAHA
jgi:Cd2+/Zn2+-exporting ATPase